MNSIPEINWDNPITKDLCGLVYTGPQFSIELVGAVQWCAESFTTKTPTAYGIGTEVTSTAGGIYSVRQSLETSANSAANWRPTAPPITIAWLGGFTNPGSTRSLFGVIGSNGTEGFCITSAFSTSTRYAHMGTGVGTRISVDNSTTPLIPGDTTWYPGIGLRAATVDANNIKVYDFGKLMAQNSGSSSNTFYDTAFGRVQILSSPDGTNCIGTSHWAGIWSRVLNETEILSLQNNSWQLFKSSIQFPFYNTVLHNIPQLDTATTASSTSTSARLRVNVDFTY